MVPAIQTGTLMAGGDQIAQHLIERRRYTDLDFVRTAKFGCIGFFMVGPTVRTWYGILDKLFGSKGTTTTLKKVACDQLLFAPIFIATLISTIGLSQGSSLQGIKDKLKNEYPDIVTNNYKLWPMVQLINFYFIPLHYQVLVVQAVAILWNTYISYRTNSEQNT